MHPSEKNFLIFDNDCGFCQRSIEVFKKILGNKIDYIPSTSLPNNFYGLEFNTLNSSIKFFERKEKHEIKNEHERVQFYDDHEVHEDGIIYHGARAIFQALSYSPSWSVFLLLYKYFPFYAPVSEAVYRVIARNRTKISAALGVDQCIL